MARLNPADSDKPRLGEHLYRPLLVIHVELPALSPSRFLFPFLSRHPYESRYILRRRADLFNELPPSAPGAALYPANAAANEILAPGGN